MKQELDYKKYICRLKSTLGMFLGLYEYFKDIPGEEGKYQISTEGRVKSLARIKNGPRGTIREVPELFLKYKINKNGYVVYHLRGNKESWPSAHVLVAKTFIHNSETKLTVNHKDANKQNNHISNLEWATHKEQMKHALDNSLFKERKNKNLSKDFKIEIYNYYLKSGCSIIQLGKKYNISERTAGRIANGDTGYAPKISKEQNKKIRELRLSGYTLEELSKLYNISISQVHRETEGIRGLRCSKQKK